MELKIRIIDLTFNERFEFFNVKSERSDALTDVDFIRLNDITTTLKSLEKYDVKEYITRNRSHISSKKVFEYLFRYFPEYKIHLFNLYDLE